jgi:hypothetical protein
MIRAGRAASTAILAAIFLSPGAALGSDSPAAACPAIDVPAPPAPARVRAFVDPATGRLREPTKDELRELAEKRLQSRRAAAPPVFEVVTHPDGMQTVVLGDAFLFDVRLEAAPDGTRRLVCVPRAGHAGPEPEK